MQLSSRAKLLVKSNCAAILRVQDKGGSSGRWPMPVLKSTNEASIYSEPVLAKTLYNHINYFLSRGYSIKEVADFFPYPSPVARLMMIFRSRVIWDLNRNQYIQLANWLADILFYHFKKDYFCYHGKNILLSPDDVEKISKIKHYYIDPALMAKLDGKLWIYTEIIFSRWHNLAHEFHGPYSAGKTGQKLLIKEWHDLTGLDWKIFKDFPYKKIICYEFYKNNKLFIDLHNRFLSKYPLIKTTNKCMVSTDGKFLTTQKVKQLIKQLDRYLSAGAKLLSGKTGKDLKLINAMMEFYTTKPLADARGVSWHPPRTLLAKISAEKLGKKEKKVLDRLRYYYPRFNQQNIRIQFDPSVKFR